MFGVMVFVKGWREKKNGAFPDDYETDFVIGAIIMGISLMFFLAFFYEFLTFTFNPQYAASNMLQGNEYGMD